MGQELNKNTENYSRNKLLNVELKATGLKQ